MCVQNNTMREIGANFAKLSLAASDGAKKNLVGSVVIFKVASTTFEQLQTRATPLKQNMRAHI